jgi:hypothetical protein
VSLNTYATLTPAPTVFQTNTCFYPAPCGNAPNAQIADPDTIDQDGTILITYQTNNYFVAYGTTSRTFPIKAPTPPIAIGPVIIISAVLPNPPGNDEQAETVTLHNEGAAAVSLVRVDASRSKWRNVELAGSLAAAESCTFRRNGQAMSLNNGGDEITLFDAARVAHDRFKYPATAQGTVLTTQH